MDGFYLVFLYLYYVCVFALKEECGTRRFMTGENFDLITKRRFPTVTRWR